MNLLKQQQDTFIRVTLDLKKLRLYNIVMKSLYDILYNIYLSYCHNIDI